MHGTDDACNKHASRPVPLCNRCNKAFCDHTFILNRRHPMQWTTPAFTDLRFGFEITMYIAHR